jgi:hypothetical protein
MSFILNTFLFMLYLSPVQSICAQINLDSGLLAYYPKMLQNESFIYLPND